MDLVLIFEDKKVKKVNLSEIDNYNLQRLVNVFKQTLSIVLLIEEIGELMSIGAVECYILNDVTPEKIENLLDGLNYLEKKLNYLLGEDSVEIIKKETISNFFKTI